MKTSKAALVRLYRELLFDGIIPFWQRRGIDEELGGVLSCMREDGKRVSNDKYLWSQARWVWVCSALYNRMERRPEFLKWARETIDFLLRNGRDRQGRWAYRLSREGRVLEGATSIYSDCFVVYGLSEYYRAVPDPEILKVATETFDCILDRIEKPEFSETAPYKLPPNRRNHGVPMILTEVAGELARTTGSHEHYSAARAFATRVMNSFVRPEKQCLVEFLDRKYQEVPSPEGTFVMPGHAIESMWFCMRRRREWGERRAANYAATVMRWHLEKGWDPEYGGILLGIDAEGGEPFLPNSDAKVWWPHTEALYGCLLAEALTGEDWCVEWYERVHEWSFKHFPMPKTGEWRQRLDRKGDPMDTVVALPVKDPFHLPRAIILILELLAKR